MQSTKTLPLLFLLVLPLAGVMYPQRPLARSVGEISMHGMIAPVGPVTLSNDGKVALAARSHSLKIWDISTGRVRRTIKVNGSINAVALSPDGRQAAAGGDKAVSIFDVATGQLLRRLDGHGNAIDSIALSPDGKHLLSASEDSAIKLWSTDDGALIRTFKEPNAPAQALAFAPDGQRFLSGSERLRLWDSGTGQLIRTLGTEDDPVYSITFSRDGRLAVSGDHVCQLLLWDVATGLTTHEFEHNGTVFHCRVSAVAFSPDGQRVLSGGWTEAISSGDVEVDNSIKLWDIQTEGLLRTFKGHRNGVVSLAFSKDGRRLLSGSLDGTVKTWGVSTGRLLGNLTVSRSP